MVTGGTRGIGLGIARALAQDGWDLAIAGLRPREEVERVITSLAEQGGVVRYVQADVGRAADRARLVAEAESLGPVAALVNNAGRAPRVRADLLETAEESFEELLRTNLQGPYFLAQAFARAMVAAQAGRPSRTGHRVHHLGLCRDGIDQSRRVLREQSGARNGRQVVRRPPGAPRHSRLRSATRDHRHRHDGRGEGSLRPAYRRRTGPEWPLGHARRCRGLRSPPCFAATCRMPRAR